MRDDYILCCVWTFLLVTFKSISSMCTQNCLCKDRGNDYTVCHFDRHVEENITADVLFDSPVEYIRNLRLEFNSNGNVVFLNFSFKAFFRLGFNLVRDLSIISNKQLLNNLELFQMEELQLLPELSSFTFCGEEIALAPINMSMKLNLRHLNVSFLGYLTFEQLCNLVKVSGTALEEVYADGINYDSPRDKILTTTLNDAFFSCFDKTSLRVLYIPRSNIKQISSPNISRFVPSLEVFDVSHNVASIDFNTCLGVFKLEKLRNINISDFPIMQRNEKRKCINFPIIQTRQDDWFCKYFSLPSVRMFHSLEVLNFGGNNDCRKSNTFGCAHQSQCIFPNSTVLRELYLNHICILRMDIHIRGLNRLEILDFSSNQCEYISSMAFSDMASLTNLLLNGNSLAKMEETDPEELRILFRNNSNLRFLNLSANGFTRLYSDIFKANTKLEWLDLSENILESTDWLSSALVQLRLLNLKRNRLKTIKPRIRHVIENFGNEYKYSDGDVGEIHGIQIYLANNPIGCGCDQEDLIHWLSRAKHHIYDFNEIVCSNAGGFLSVYIDDIESHKNSCNFHRYRGLLVLCTIPIIVTVCVVLYVRYYRRILRIRRIRKHLDELVQYNFQVQRRFLLYLAYSFSDSDIVLNKIFPELEGRLQKEVGEKENLVCISDRDFHVGVSIADEIIHAVTSSSAVLFIISKEFAHSRWCEFEAETALYEGKPIILVTLGNLKVRSLPSSLRKVCFKWTRLKWPGSNNQAKLEEFWQKLISAIIKDTASIPF